MSNTRKIIAILVVAFIVYAIFTRPDQSADTVGSAWDYLERGATRLGQFFGAVMDS